MYVELSSIQEELKKMDYKEKLPRSCQDLRTQSPRSQSGHYTIDPNVGSNKDSIKCFCEFSSSVAKTCVKVIGGIANSLKFHLFHFFLQNSTSTSQIGYLHMLHTRVSQSIDLPCGTKGPLRYVCRQARG